MASLQLRAGVRAEAGPPHGAVRRARVSPNWNYQVSAAASGQRTELVVGYGCCSLRCNFEGPGVWERESSERLK